MVLVDFDQLAFGLIETEGLTGLGEAGETKQQGNCTGDGSKHGAPP